MGNFKSLHLRAVVLVLLMVLGSVSGVGSVTGSPTEASLDEGDTTPAAWTESGGLGTVSTANAQSSTDPVSVNVNDLKGRLFWQGQELRVTGLNPGTSYEVRRVTGSDSSNLAVERTANDDGAIVVRTTSLQPAFYFLWGGDYDRENTRFELAQQTITASWTERSIYRNERARLTIDSNRASYQIEVSARGLTFSQLERLFDAEHRAEDHDAKRSDGVIILNAGGETELRADFSRISIPDGAYGFTVNARDTTATATATITIGIRRADISLSTATVSEAAGDIVAMAVRLKNTRQGYVVIGSEQSNFLDVVRVTDGNDDGTVTLRVNTRYAGLKPSAPGVPSDVRVYSASPRDSLKVYDGSDTLASGRTLDSVRRDLDIDRGGLTRPLRPGSYAVSLATTDDIRAGGGSLDVRNERAIGFIDLQSPSLDGQTVGVASSANAGIGDASTIKSATTTRQSVALGDRVVLRFDVSGVFGHLLAEHDNSITGLVDNEAEGVSLTVRQTNPSQNRQPVTIDLTHSSARLYVDEQANQLLVVLDSRNLQGNRPIEVGQEYRARLVIRAVESNREYNVMSSNSANYRGYPYLQSGQTAEVSATFRFVQPRAEFEGIVNDRLEVRNGAGVRISGTTNLAPGSELQVRHLSTGTNPFVRLATATVRSDGTWAATYDFTVARIGQEFTATIRGGGATLQAVDGIIVEEPATPTPTRTETPVHTPSPTSTPAPTATPTSSPTTSTASTDTPGQPGFGFALAIIALLAAALLSHRRRD